MFSLPFRAAMAKTVGLRLLFNRLPSSIIVGAGSSKGTNMKTKNLVQSTPDIQSVILTVRGQKVILDSDLALIYGVPTKVLNQAIKRNKERFPSDFFLRLTRKEWREVRLQIAADLDLTGNRSQFVTGSQRHRDLRT